MKRDALSAVTRGDGFQGDDVSANIKTIRSIPMELHADFVQDFGCVERLSYPRRIPKDESRTNCPWRRPLQKS